MIIFDEERPSDSPFVERIWRSHSERGFSLPKERIASVTVPTFVIEGGETP